MIDLDDLNTRGRARHPRCAAIADRLAELYPTWLWTVGPYFNAPVVGRSAPMGEDGYPPPGTWDVDWQQGRVVVRRWPEYHDTPFALTAPESPDDADGVVAALATAVEWVRAWKENPAC